MGRMNIPSRRNVAITFSLLGLIWPPRIA